MSCFQNRGSLFSFISTHKAQCHPTSLPKDNNPPIFSASEDDQYMPSMGQSFDHWYLIETSEYLRKLHIALVSTCVSIHMFTSDVSLFQSLIRIICSP